MSSHDVAESPQPGQSVEAPGGPAGAPKRWSAPWVLPAAAAALLLALGAESVRWLRDHDDAPIGRQERVLQASQPPLFRTVGVELPPGPDGGERRADPLFDNRNSAARGEAIGGREGTTRHAEAAVMAGLICLAKAQEADGHWDCKRWDGGLGYDVAMTGLALLAFQGAGYTQAKGRFKTTVGNALKWLSTTQKADGNFAWKTYYEQGMATMAVCEAFGMTKAPDVGRVAQAAIDAICRTQPAHGGFRYGGAVEERDADMSVTSWQMAAIWTALAAGLRVPQEAVDRCRLFLKNTYRGDGGTAYLVGGTQAAPAMTAAGMLARQLLGGDYDAEINAGAARLSQYQQKSDRIGPGAGKDHLVGDLYYTYYSTHAMFRLGGEYWARWNRLFRDPLVKCQISQQFDTRGRFVRGSWDPKNHEWGSRGGRVYATAMAILCLEVYYRYATAQKPKPEFRNLERN